MNFKNNDDGNNRSYTLHWNRRTTYACMQYVHGSTEARWVRWVK